MTPLFWVLTPFLRGHGDSWGLGGREREGSPNKPLIRPYLRLWAPSPSPPLPPSPHETLQACPTGPRLQLGRQRRPLKPKAQRQKVLEADGAALLGVGALHGIFVGYFCFVPRPKRAVSLGLVSSGLFSRPRPKRSKHQHQTRTLVSGISGNNQNLRNPSCLILSHTNLTPRVAWFGQLKVYLSRVALGVPALHLHYLERECLTTFPSNRPKGGSWTVRCTFPILRSSV